MDFQPLDCDTIVVNYNAGQMLEDCVASALEAGSARVIVVDNASRDDSLAKIEARFAGDQRLTVIRNGANLGFSAGCNVGIKASTAGSVFFLNPDGRLERGALARLMEVLHSEAKIGMVGGFLCNPDGSEQPGGRRQFPTPENAFAYAFGLTKIAPKLFPNFRLENTPLPAEPVDIPAMSGACMLVKRAALEDVGLWDEGYFLHCEDLDWCMRFLIKHWRLVYVPDAPVKHVWGGSSKSRPIFVEWHKHRGMIRFYRKFYRTNYSGLVWAAVVAGVWLRFGLIAAYYTMRRVI
jgi:GT2 family glycosyltransferase